MSVWECCEMASGLRPEAISLATTPGSFQYHMNIRACGVIVEIDVSLRSTRVPVLIYHPSGRSRVGSDFTHHLAGIPVGERACRPPLHEIIDGTLHCHGRR